MWLFRRSFLGKPAPDITGDTWFNHSALPSTVQTKLTDKQSLRLSVDLPGYVVLVNFWDYSCVSCTHALPQLRALWKRYRDSPFLIIGIHTPEFDFARDPEKVQDAVIRFTITYPVVNDPDLANWERYKTREWPRNLLVDQDGIVQYDHSGAGGWEELEAVIEKLVA